MHSYVRFGSAINKILESAQLERLRNKEAHQVAVMQMIIATQALIILGLLQKFVFNDE